jgi:hypothetical protein
MLTAAATAASAIIARPTLKTSGIDIQNTPGGLCDPDKRSQSHSFNDKTSLVFDYLAPKIWQLPPTAS